ncbi:hypothetical protein BDZ90DRAFT_210966, partial [Jaminaea rosea]
RPNDAKSGPKGEPMTPILSASLVVLTPTPASSLSVSTLMLQRSARAGSSFRSAVVFPGGALDLADEAAVGCPTEVSDQDDVAGKAEYRRALQLCALRETFEETGLLLLPSDRQSAGGVPFSRAVGAKEAGLSPKEWAKKRDEVHEDAGLFPDFLLSVAKRIGIQGAQAGAAAGSIETTQDVPLPTLPLVPLAYHSHWITPRSVVRPGKRFSAHFFLTILDTTSAPSSSGQASRDELPSLALSADGSETLSLRVSPLEDFIEATLRDEILLYPPQFYILADLYATMGQGAGAEIGERARKLAPLAFGGRPRQGNGVTPVEEEPRGLAKGTNYAWDRETEKPTGWVATSKGHAVTAVEPHALPKQGGTMALNFEKRPSSLSNGKEGEQEGEEEEDTPFVFPLVLPGDWQASKSQRRAAGVGDESASSPSTSQRPLNRIYVSPRNPEHGGGLIARGARRRGLPGLVDWKVGFELEEGRDEELGRAD